MAGPLVNSLKEIEQIPLLDFVFVKQNKFLEVRGLLNVLIKCLEFLFDQKL